MQSRCDTNKSTKQFSLFCASGRRFANLVEHIFSMKSYYRILGFILFLGLFTACTKTDQEVIDLLKDIKAQNDALKAQITALQKTSDSLALALKGTNQTIGNMDKKIDSVRNQLVVVLSQLNALNAQMTQANVNIADIQAKIVVLQAKCAELYNLLYGFINPGAPSNIALVAYYPFTGNALDSTSNSNHGTVIGASLTSDRFGKLNSAYRFRGFGNNDHIRVNKSSSLTFSDSMTISIWYKEEVGNSMNGNGNLSTTNGIGALFSKAGDGIGSQPGFAADLNFEGAAQKISFFNVDGCCQAREKWTDVASYTKVISNSDQWKHLTIVNTKSYFEIYHNGVLYFHKDINSTFIGANGQNLYFGIYGWGNLAPYWYPYHGSLDDVRIYNRVLNASEIKYLSSH